jgi:hypothetical protein
MKFGPPLFWLGVSLWVGGLAALALAAPTIFRTAPSRESAGLIFGNVLRSFSFVEIACAVLAVAGLALSWSRPPVTIDWVRAGLLGLMIVVDRCRHGSFVGEFCPRWERRTTRSASVPHKVWEPTSSSLSSRVDRDQRGRPRRQRDGRALNLDARRLIAFAPGRGVGGRFKGPG